jgi:two-component system sensor histidine kinase KdpD
VLRQVAEDVEQKRLVRVPVSGSVSERLLALVAPRPSSQRVVRRAWRSAQRLGAALDVLTVIATEPSEEERQQLEALHRLTSLLGAHLLVEEGDDIAEVAKRVVAERDVTYVLVGAPDERRGLDRLRPTLVERLLRALPGIDVRIVADRKKREEAP